jgi:hypothetical protein
MSSHRLSATLSEFKLKGSASLPAGKDAEFTFDLNGGLSLNCDYLNDTKNVRESFVEDWGITFHGEGSKFEILSPNHLVANITPPLLHAVGFVVQAIQLANSEPTMVSEALPPAESEESKGVGAWVWNGTGHDIEVSLTGPAGTGDIITMPRKEFKTLGKVPLRRDQVTYDAKILACRKRFDWILKFSGTSPEGKKWDAPDVPVRVAGRHLYHLSDIGCNLVVNVLVEVNSQVPVVLIHGASALHNTSNKVIVVSTDRGDFSVPTGGTYNGCLGGGEKIVSKTREGHELVTNLKTDKEIHDYARFFFENPDGEALDQESLMTDKFFLDGRKLTGPEVVKLLGVRPGRNIDLIDNNPQKPFTRVC